MKIFTSHKGKVTALVLVVLLVGLSLVVSGRFTKNNTEPVRIGIITPLTGQYAMFGEVNKNATLLAKEDFGSENVELFIEDDAYDTKKAVSAYQKLKSMHNIDAVIVLGAPSIQAIKPLTDRDNIPLLGLGVTLVYEKDSVFQMMPSGDSVLPEQGKIYSEKYNRVFVVHSPAELFRNNALNFVSGLDTSDLVQKVEIPQASDYRTEISKMLASNPEVVFVSMPIDDALKFVKQLNVLDPMKKVNLVCDFQVGLSPQKFIDAGGEKRIDGCVMVENANTTDVAFKERYENVFKTDLLITGDFTYDAIGMIVSLNKVYPKNEWIRALSSSEYQYPTRGAQSVSGRIKFNENGTRLDEKLNIKVFQGGKFELVK